MRRFLNGIAALIWLGTSAAALPQQVGMASVEAIPARHVAGNLHVLESGTRFSGGSIAVLVGREAVLLVDAKGASFSSETLAAVKSLSDRPVRYVINTHCHADHVGNNAAFQRSGALVIARDSVYQRLQPEKKIECGQGGVGSPDITFGNELTLHFEDDEVSVIALPVGHTDGDAFVYFKRANVVHTGDAFAWPVPFHSRAAGGNALGLLDGLRKIVQSVPDDAKVIPGHGPQATVADIRRAIRVLDEVQTVIAQQIRAGRTLEEMKTMKLLDPWKTVLGEEFDWTLKALYEALANQEHTTAAASVGSDHR